MIRDGEARVTDQMRREHQQKLSVVAHSPSLRTFVHRLNSFRLRTNVSNRAKTEDDDQEHGNEIIDGGEEGIELHVESR